MMSDRQVAATVLEEQYVWARLVVCFHALKACRTAGDHLRILSFYPSIDTAVAAGCGDRNNLESQK